ncbi:MAG: hypothetical protein HQ567_30430 [Candidatus Nealsonbacteria bacterium]|nr:hypothetical protein [Candidatus Nealsonbacteria bacterium]
MPTMIRRMAPVAIVTAVMVWCCWPYLDASLTGYEGGLGMESTPSTTLPQIDAALLSSDIPSMSSSNPGRRNPFQPQIAGEMPLVKSLATCLVNAESWKNDMLTLLGRSSPEKVVAAARPNAALAVPAVETLGQAAPTTEQECAKIVDQLVLSATCVQGDQRTAIINGCLYEQGQPLPISGLTKGPCTVARVSAYEVVIEYAGRTVELGYPNPQSFQLSVTDN